MAYDFNGTNQYLISTSYSGETALPLTYAAWFNTDVQDTDVVLQTGETGGSGRAGFISIRDTTNSFNTGVSSFDGTGSDISLSGSAYSTGTWTHLCGVITSSTSRLVYQNGTAGTTNTGSRSLAITFGQLVIGALKLGGSAASNHFNGRLAEVATWNVALTAAEIASLAKGFKPTRVRPQSIQMYAPLVADIRDLRKGLVLTNTNSATVAVHTRVY